ncbi:uncharacterized protein PV07_07889 [Cladophialophora immunda]|uniref:Uncharacterized protein n=1 Tax=Cladophialophora immunda TaxID=569365 RepID=A0A0D2CX69_9EURO|nr:uncharacterized protein PV07_07889 [Cladophialophora immunda]KIW28209.1 hypothetical protein PV07_07889 [Cladophialophora immunda]OQV00322.1 hypothetical protein CLAIMM_05832 [Cladophialophora immunda]
MAQLRSMGSGTDVLSMSAKSTRATLPHAAAPPSYVSVSEAEKLVYAEIDRLVKISNNAVHLLNGFLDQILYDILSKSQSTALGAVRAAIPLVLKQRLGRAAIKAADEELQDYLEEDELENIQNHPAVLDPRAEFDVDLAWKLTRLRCMVYAKLGDMEEEDEEDYLDGDDVREHLSQVKEAYRSSARISPHSAIFLSTILEFIAEQALCIAAQHARKRTLYIKDAARETAPAQQHPDPDVIFLEEIDMSGIGKEGPLIRLWRSWKGSIRTGGSMSSRPTTPNIMSPLSPESPMQEWKFPAAPVIPPIQEEGSRSVTPANIPLPMTENDVDEIEVPGLARTFEEVETNEQRPTPGDRRPTSMLVMPGQFPASSAADEHPERPSPSRRRSRSVPTSSKASSSAQLATRSGLSPPLPVHGDKDEMGDTEGIRDEEVQHPRDGSRSVLRSSAIGATVATIAGALNVEAAKAFRRERPSHELTPPVSPESGGEQRMSNNTGDDLERMHIPTRLSATGMDVVDPESHEGTGDPEDLALSSSDGEGAAAANDHTNPRDSGFSVAGPANDIHEHEQEVAADETEPQITNHHDYEQVQGESGAAGRSSRYSNLGYATIFQTPDTSSGYSNPNSTRSFVQGMARSNDAGANSATTTPSTTSAWPAVIPNRRSSLDPQKPEYLQSEMRAPQQLPPSYHSSENQEPAEKPQELIPRFATSALATQNGRSRSGSAKDGRPSTSGSGTVRRQHIRLRSDNEEVWPREDLDRAKKSLDLLIDSDETLHYTLTPASANVGGKVKVKSQTQELADFFRTTAPPGEEVRPKSSRSAKDGLRANPPATSIKSTQPQTSGQQSAASPSKPKNRLGEPREARMVRNNTRDLADYARSTGPEHEAQLPKLLSARPATAQSARAELSLREKVFGVDGENRPSTTSGKPSSRLKYQARDARGPRTAESSDLIDFIREGPPRAPGEHRIDRSVAPFRTTMDSDDLNALAPPPELDAKGRNSDGSAQESAMTVKSMPSSMNSRTGLLDSTNRAAGKFTNGFGSSATAISKQPVIPETDGMPRRNRPKIRDPYAIDYSDEEEEEMEEEHEPPRRRTDEESLVDFLRNTAPPPGMTTQPILAAMPNPTQPDPASMVRQSTSSTKLKDFLPGGSASSARNNPHASGNTATPNTRPVNIARAESPHLTQVGSRMDKYRPTTTTHAPHVERNRQKMRVQPRDATTNSNGGGTADLAAYLMSSGPPPGVNEKPPQKLGGNVQKDQAGFLKFFQRRGSVRK